MLIVLDGNLTLSMSIYDSLLQRLNPNPHQNVGTRLKKRTKYTMIGRKRASYKSIEEKLAELKLVHLGRGSIIGAVLQLF